MAYMGLIDIFDGIRLNRFLLIFVIKYINMPCWNGVWSSHLLARSRGFKGDHNGNRSPTTTNQGIYICNYQK